MKSKFKQMITTIVSMAVMAAMFVSCDKETETPATANGFTHIKFETVTKAASTGFQRVDLFAFDESGIFAGRWNCCESQITVEIKPGKYTFVAWGNLAENYTLKPQTPVCGQTRMDNITLIMPETAKDAAATVFAGSLASAQILSNAPDQTFSIQLEEATANLSIEIGVAGWGVINAGTVTM